MASAARRLPPEERRAQILEAATSVLRRDGVDAFSLEAVAREADVAATLPRHYFESRDGLLASALKVAILDVVEPFLRPDAGLGFEERVRLYLAKLREFAWGHAIWQRAESVHPDVEAVVIVLRRRLVGASFGKRWQDMTPDEQLHGAGWVGYFSAAVAEWIAQGKRDDEVLVETLVAGARRFGVMAA
jgi:AcrR family transcriptional regulator